MKKGACIYVSMHPICAVAAPPETVQTDTSATNAGDFMYVTEAGARYTGGPARGLRPPATSNDPLICSGFLRVLYDGSATLVTPASSGATPTRSTATVHLVAVLDLVHLTATVQFKDSTNNLAFQTNTDAPRDMRQAADQYSTATMHQDWATVYSLTSKAVVSGYTEAQFATLMQDQVKSVGTITNLTVTSAPVIATTKLGVTYFTVNEEVTMSHNGTSSTFEVEAVYVLEDGVWNLWFTQNR